MPEYDDDATGCEPPFPGTVRLAGIIWITFGMLGLCGQFLAFALAGAAKAGAGAGAGAGKPAGGCCGFVIAGAFLYVGYQTVTGKAKDTLGNAIGSIGLGLLYFVIGIGAALFAGGVFGAGGMAGQQELLIVLAAVVSVFGAMLIGAGALALMGRAAYEEWRRAERERRERDYDEEERDRPRRRRRRDRDEDRDARDKD